jgi:hypothetical protein
MPFIYDSKYAPSYNSIGDHHIEYTGIRNHHHSTYAPTFDIDGSEVRRISWWGDSTEGTKDMWNTFFRDYYPLNEKEYQAFLTGPDYHHELFGDYLRRWYEGKNTPSTLRTNYDNKDNYDAIKTSWSTFLDDSDVKLRRNAPFVWVYRLLNNMLNDIQNIMVAEANRVTVLTNSEQTVINDLKGITYPKQKSSKDYDFMKKSKEASLAQQVYLGQKGVQQGKTSKASGHIEATNQATTQTANLMDTMMSMLRDVLSAAFRP